MSGGKRPSRTEGDRKVVAVNRRARHDYHLERIFEAGISLKGTEVKSLRAGRANLREAYGEIKGGRIWLQGCHISPYQSGTRDTHDPLRPRPLLLHKEEIRYLQGKVAEKGWTLIPLSLYFKGSRAKVELALARGKRLYDKREDERRRLAEKEAQAALKGQAL